MPYTMEWVSPELMLSHKDVSIYHTYDHDQENERLDYHFTTHIEYRQDYCDDCDNSDTENYSCHFDIRDLPGYQKMKDERFDDYAILKFAIEQGIIKKDGMSLKCHTEVDAKKYVAKARTWRIAKYKKAVEDWNYDYPGTGVLVNYWEIKTHDDDWETSKPVADVTVSKATIADNGHAVIYLKKKGMTKLSHIRAKFDVFDDVLVTAKPGDEFLHDFLGCITAFKTESDGHLYAVVRDQENNSFCVEFEDMEHADGELER